MTGFRYLGLVIFAAASCPSDRALGAPATAENPLGCEPGRNAGHPTPKWWGPLQPLLARQREYFPPGVDLAFLGAWIENESNGRHGVESRLGEVGYFQLHPAEIEDMVGADHVDTVVAQIKSSKAQDLRWGGALLQRYDDAITRFGIPRGTRLYHGLLKVMHSSRPRGIRWIEHVKAVLGRNPVTFEEFLAVAREIKHGAVAPRITKKIPAKLPSCSPGRLLDRSAAFNGPTGWTSEGHEGWEDWVLRSVPVMAQTSVLSLMGSSFPGVAFTTPIRGVIVASGWRQPRGYRDGWHEGFDFYAPRGTPVRAAAAGVVDRWTGEHAGKALHVKHAGGWTTRYMHLDQQIAKDGQRVAQGEIIGTVGATGTKSSAPHLHFALLLQENLLPVYEATYGKPKGGFGRKHGPGVAVPSETLIPVAGYEADVIADARRNGVPLYMPERKLFPWGKAFAGASAAVFVGVVLLRYWSE